MRWDGEWHWAYELMIINKQWIVYEYGVKFRKQTSEVLKMLNSEKENTKKTCDLWSLLNNSKCFWKFYILLRLKNSPGKKTRNGPCYNKIVFINFYFLIKT